MKEVKSYHSSLCHLAFWVNLNLFYFWRSLQNKISPPLGRWKGLFEYPFLMLYMLKLSLSFQSCMSHVGRHGGQQGVTIGHGCTRLGTCQHELLHALGTIHEQSRPDRNDHVTIVWDNIKESK